MTAALGTSSRRISSRLVSNDVVMKVTPVTLPQARDETEPHRIIASHENDRNGLGRCLRCQARQCPAEGGDDIHGLRHQFSRKSGQPILLMADRQTTGGYPKIATVITADLTVAGQLAPADTITFAVATPREAMSALIAQERALMAIEARLP